MPILGTVASGFTILVTPTVEYLVVAGGGGGGHGYYSNDDGAWMGGGGGAGLEADLLRIRCFFSSLMCISLIRRSIRERRSLLALLSISLVEAMYELRVTRKADETWTNCITISGGIGEAKDVEKGGKGETPGTPPAKSPAAPAAVAAAPAAIISSTAGHLHRLRLGACTPPF
jgi:hypothetical protein